MAERQRGGEPGPRGQKHSVYLEAARNQDSIERQGQTASSKQCLRESEGMYGIESAAIKKMGWKAKQKRSGPTEKHVLSWLALRTCARSSGERAPGQPWEPHEWATDRRV